MEGLSEEVLPTTFQTVNIIQTGAESCSVLLINVKYLCLLRFYEYF